MNILLIVNAAAAGFAAVYSTVAAFRPQIIPPHEHDRGPFLYAYTSRAVGLAVLAIPVLLNGVTPVAALAALALGLAQAGDIAAFLRVEDRRIVTGASIGAFMHIASAVVFTLALRQSGWRRSRSRRSVHGFFGLDFDGGVNLSAIALSDVGARIEPLCDRTRGWRRKLLRG